MCNYHLLKIYLEVSCNRCENNSNVVDSRYVSDRGLWLLSARATQSIGLLSFTFLRQTGHDDVVVPMVSSYTA